jgi:hypothetical protein
MIIPTFNPFIFPEEEGHFACLLIQRFKCQDIRMTTPGKTSVYITNAGHVVTGNAVQKQVFEPEENLTIRIEPIT